MLLFVDRMKKAVPSLALPEIPPKKTVVASLISQLWGPTYGGISDQREREIPILLMCTFLSVVAGRMLKVVHPRGWSTTLGDVECGKTKAMPWFLDTCFYFGGKPSGQPLYISTWYNLFSACCGMSRNDEDAFRNAQTDLISGWYVATLMVCV